MFEMGRRLTSRSLTTRLRRGQRNRPTVEAAVAQPLGSMRFFPQIDEEVAPATLDAVERPGFKIVRQDAQQPV